MTENPFNQLTDDEKDSLLKIPEYMGQAIPAEHAKKLRELRLIEGLEPVLTDEGERCREEIWRQR